MRNATESGAAPEWSVTAMVMNHYKKQKRFYVRTKLWYTTDARTQVYPTTVGDCRHLANGMAYDVPGGGKPGSTFVDRSSWTVPFNARILSAGSHHHGGATHQTLVSKTCNRTLVDARAYYGAADHPYNTIRPILHEPGPIANGTFETAQGIPISAGEVLERTAVHDDSTLHVAAMGFWILNLVRDDTVTACAPMPTDIREVMKPARYDRKAPYVYDRKVPQLFKPTGKWRAFSGTSISIGDRFFQPAMLTAHVGQKLTWNFAGVEPHSVTVANGPRGFSSNYLGNTSGSYSFTPTVPGTYRLTCLIHPTTMAQTVKVARELARASAQRRASIASSARLDATAVGEDAASETAPAAPALGRARETLERLEEVQAEAVERFLGLDVELLELAGEEHHAHRDQDHAGDRR